MRGMRRGREEWGNYMEGAKQCGRAWAGGEMVEAGRGKRSPKARGGRRVARHSPGEVRPPKLAWYKDKTAMSGRARRDAHWGAVGRRAFVRGQCHWCGGRRPKERAPRRQSK